MLPLASGLLGPRRHICTTVEVVCGVDIDRDPLDWSWRGRPEMAHRASLLRDLLHPLAPADGHVGEERLDLLDGLTDSGCGCIEEPANCERVEVRQVARGNHYRRRPHRPGPAECSDDPPERVVVDAIRVRDDWDAERVKDVLSSNDEHLRAATRSEH